MFLIPHNLKLHELFNKKHKIIWSLKIGTTISVFILHSLVVLPIPSGPSSLSTANQNGANAAYRVSMRAREFFFGGSALPSLGVPHPDCGPGEGSLSTTGVAYVFSCSPPRGQV